MAAVAAALAAATLGVLLAPAPLRADWIVTRHGERFEIQGTWEVKGKVVVFTLPNGALSSMRADRVDLEASKQATEQAKQQAAAPPPAPAVKSNRRAVIVLTDKDFKKTPLPDGPPPGAAAAPGAAAGSAADSKKGGKDAPPARDVANGAEVVGWDRVPAAESKADGAEITGTVRNASQDNLTEVNVVADLFDDNGSLIGRFPAVVDNQVLPPTESSKFRVVATGVFAFASIRWETTSKGFRSAPGNAPAARPPS